MKGRAFHCAVIVLLGAWLGACSETPEITDARAYKAATDLEDRAERVAALEAFVADYPDSERKSRALRRLYFDYVRLDREAEAVRAAEAFVASLGEDGRMMDLNAVAWTLVEADMGLEQAEAWAAEAVDLARKEESRFLGMILDTHAFAVYKLGDPARAEEMQNEAIQGHEDDADYLGRLALYQHANGRDMKALETQARTLLHGGGEEQLDHFNSWLEEGYPDEAERLKTKEKVVAATLDEYLKEASEPRDKSRAAVLLARTGVNLARAERLARQAIAEMDRELPLRQQTAYQSALATVLNAGGRHEEAIETLAEFKGVASLWDRDFWVQLGRAYDESGQKEDALDAFSNTLLARQIEEVVEELEARSFTREMIDARVAAKKAELLEFDPGQYAGKTSGRVVLAELFTGAECPPCVAADLGFDHLASYYPRTALAILEHHLHIPGADPMTNTDTESRYEFYGAGFGTPTVFINGTERVGGGGPDLLQRENFYRYQHVIDPALQTEAGFSLSASAAREGDRVAITVEVEARSDAGAANLHIALLEKSVGYKGGNGIEHHAFVVRHLVQGAEGMELKAGTSTHAIDLNQVQQAVTKYLDDFTATPPERYEGFPGWEKRADQIDRSNLAVVVWVQDNVSKQVFQTAFAEVK